jgi:adenylate cyclase
MTMPALSSLGRVFDGVYPTTLATSSQDGDVNVIFVSQVHYVDEEHVAFSEQFLQHTLANLRQNPRAQAWLIEPVSGAQYRLDLGFVRREIEGPLVERMRAKLDGIAEMAGMTEVFRLRAALVCRVLAIRRVAVATEEAPAMESSAERMIRIASFGELADCLSRAEDLEATCRALLDGLGRLGYQHSLLLLADDARRSLVTIDSRGFAESGIGSEVDIGYGVFGRCAATRQAVRVNAMSRDETYVRVSQSTSARQIPGPVLSGAESLLAVPLVSRERLVGVLAVQSSERMAFGEADEAALKLIAHVAASAIVLAEREPSEVADPRPPVRVRYYEEDDSVFVDDTYAVKGLAGRALLAILKTYTEQGRAEITNRELRLDPVVKLPQFNDNLEARLLLLRRRLEERSARLRVLSVTRGRLRIESDGPVELEIVRAPKRDGL